MKKAKVQQMSAAVNSGRKWVCAPVREYSRHIAEYERQKNQRETAFATINLRNGIFIHKSSIPAHKRYGKSKVFSISHILSFTEPYADKCVSAQIKQILHKDRHYNYKYNSRYFKIHQFFLHIITSFVKYMQKLPW